MKLISNSIQILFFLISISTFSISVLGQAALPNVTTAKIKPQKLVIYSKYVGYIEPQKRVTVPTQIAGIVKRINYKVGEKIKRKQLLVQIDSKSLKIQRNLAKANYVLSRNEYIREKKLFFKKLGFHKKEKNKNKVINLAIEQLITNRKLAESNLKLAKVDYVREQLLYKKKLSTKSKLDTLKNRLDIAKYQLNLRSISIEQAQIRVTTSLDLARNRKNTSAYQLQLSQAELNKASIHAPFNAVVKKKFFEEGEFVKKGSKLLEIMDINKVLAFVNIPEKEIRWIKKGQIVEIQLDAFPRKKFQGKIKTIAIEADRNTRSFPIEIEINNSRRTLLPGMLAKAKVKTTSLKNQVIIPRHTILEKEKGPVVFVITKNNIATERNVILGQVYKKNAQILSG
ncbi:MAG: multidrug efflux pump subunit AcrA (membrane-fusion protein), partial [bacterium]